LLVLVVVVFVNMGVSFPMSPRLQRSCRGQRRAARGFTGARSGT
jgi:hypothetical protein